MDWLTSTSKSKETLTQQLVETENIWILKLDTLYYLQSHSIYFP